MGVCKLTALLAVLLLLLLGAGCREGEGQHEGGSVNTPVEAADNPPVVSAVELKRCSELAVAYLVANCDQTGKFNYLRHPDPEYVVDDEYNLLRHAGTMYALGMYLEYQDDPACREALSRAAGWLVENALAPMDADPAIKAIWSDPELSHNVEERTAKLGGAGLGLVGLIMAEREQPGTVDYDELRALGRFIQEMQRMDGSFVCQYVPAEGGAQGLISLFYPGEAALGLAMLYELTGELTWLETADFALGHLAMRRRNSKAVPSDHWALIATAKVLEHYHELEHPLTTRELLITHAGQVCTTMLGRQLLSPAEPELYGSFSSNGKTTATAAKLEGLLAALSYLPAEQAELRAEIERASAAGLTFLKSTQITEGDLTGGIPWAAGPLPDEDDEFNKRVGEVRIDYVQHALSAMVGYAQRETTESRH